MKQKYKNISISTLFIQQEAEIHGFSTEVVGSNFLILNKKDKIVYVKGSRTSFQSCIGYSIAKNKNTTKSFLNRYNIPTAKHLLVKNLQEFQETQQLTLTFPIVAKPVDGKGGVDVYVNIKNLAEAKKIVLGLQHKYNEILLEEMLAGQEYRITCVDFKPVAVTLRKPAFVTGDGKKTIYQLIQEKNKHPWRGETVASNKPMVTIKIDEFLTECLTEQNTTIENIPKKGIEIYLRKNSNISTGGEGYNFDLKKIHSKNLDLFEKINKVCDLNVSGIDIMCADLSVPIIEQKNAGVVEINASPGIDVPQFPMAGKPVNAAMLVVEMIEKYMEK